MPNALVSGRQSALWLLELGDAECPREHACHLRSRLTRLLPDDEDRLKVVLDLDDSTMPEDHCRATFLEILDERLIPLLDRCSTLDGTPSLEATGMLSSFLVTGSAQRVLKPFYAVTQPTLDRRAEVSATVVLAVIVPLVLMAATLVEWAATTAGYGYDGSGPVPPPHGRAPGTFVRIR